MVRIGILKQMDFVSVGQNVNTNVNYKDASHLIIAVMDFQNGFIMILIMQKKIVVIHVEFSK
jgi:hypothetical protein